MFGPESIGKHITQLVANWVFPRESVFGPESIEKHITQLVANWVFPRESVFGPESTGKHITQLIANWVFPSETEYIAGGLLRKSTYPGTATPTQLQMYATDLRGEPRCLACQLPLEPSQLLARQLPELCLACQLA